MNQEIRSGTQVGILIELGSPFNTTDQHTTNTEECANNERTISEIMSEGSKSSEKKDKEFIEQQEPECTNVESEDLSEDIPLVENEQFDFDLSLSPNCVDEEDSNDEDEVFFGPVNHREKCVRAHKEIDSVNPLSPLTNEQYAELFKEAVGLVMDLQQDETTTKQKKTSGETEEFITKTLETLKLSKNYDSSPETKVDHGNKTAITESKCFKREQKKEIRSPRRQTYTISKNGITELPKASECVSRLRPGGNLVFKAKGGVQRNVPKPPTKSKNLKVLPNKQSVLKKKQELTKQMVPKQTLITSPPKKARNNSQYSDDGISDTSSIMSDVSEASTCSIPVPGRKRSLPVPKLKKSGLTMPRKLASETGSVTKAPTNKPTLMKPGTFQRRILTGSRSGMGESVSKGQQQPLKATMSLKSTKKTTPVSKIQPAAKDRGKTPQSNVSSAAKCALVKKSMPRATLPSTPRVTLPSTPVFQERRVVPKRIITSSSKTDLVQKTKSTSSPSTASSVKATPSTLTPPMPNRKMSASTTGSARRRSGIPTPMRSSTKNAIFTFNKESPTRKSSRLREVGAHQMSASPVFTHVVEKVAAPKVETPKKVDTPKKVQTPTNVQTQTKVETPTNVQTQTKVETPKKVETPMKVQTPTKIETPTNVETPTKVQTPMNVQTQTKVETPTCVASGDARIERLKCAKSMVKPSPAKTPVLIDLNDSKTLIVSPKVANLINFGDTPETKEQMRNHPANEKENLLIVI